MTVDLTRLLGKGIGFPMGVTVDGRLRWSEGDRNVRESLHLILLTDHGERVMRRDVGCSLKPLLFEPNNPATHRLIQDRIREAIERWEPRVRLESVVVHDDPNDRKRVRAAVTYQLVATGAREHVTLDLGMET